MKSNNKSGFTTLPVRKTKSEAQKSAQYWRERNHYARLQKGPNGKFYVRVKAK